MKIFRLSLLTFSLVSTLSLIPAAYCESASVHAGQGLFKEKGCAYCHGQSLQGTAKGPPLFRVKKQLKAPQIANQIENGGQKMPAFGDSLSHDEISQLVSYLRAKHKAVPAYAAPVAPTPTPEPEP